MCLHPCLLVCNKQADPVVVEQRWSSEEEHAWADPMRLECLAASRPMQLPRACNSSAGVESSAHGNSSGLEPQFFGPLAGDRPHVLDNKLAESASGLDSHVSSMECTLEAVAFQGAMDLVRTVLPTLSDAQNVAEGRGSNPALPSQEDQTPLLDTVVGREDDAERAVGQAVQGFMTSIVGWMDQPVLRSPRRRRARTPPPPSSPKMLRRSVRIVALDSVRTANATVQAQRVLIQKLGIVAEDQPITPLATSRYMQIFDKPLSSTHRKAIRALFSRNGPSVQAAVGVDGIEA